MKKYFRATMPLWAGTLLLASSEGVKAASETEGVTVLEEALMLPEDAEDAPMNDSLLEEEDILSEGPVEVLDAQDLDAPDPTLQGEEA